LIYKRQFLQSLFLLFADQLGDWGRGLSREERQKYQQVWGVLPDQVKNRLMPPEMKSNSAPTSVLIRNVSSEFF
jgi:hypothetical protein